MWSNNVHIHAHLGIASSDEAVYFAWQDTRNGNREFQSEDVYFASARFTESEPEDDDAGVPPAVRIGAGVLLGMGLSMLIVLAVSRRRGRTTT